VRPAAASSAAVTAKPMEMGGKHPRKGDDTRGRPEQDLEAISDRAGPQTTGTCYCRSA